MAYDNSASKIYSVPVEGWGNPTWTGENVRSLFQMKDKFYFSVLDSYATEFKAQALQQSPPTKRHTKPPKRKQHGRGHDVQIV